jgi:hypothetical protein
VHVAILMTVILLQMFIAVINEVSSKGQIVYRADFQNFAVAEEEKRKEQIEAFIRKSEPASAHVSWIDRLNPYRLMKAHHHSVKVETLPPNLVLPLKQNVGLDVGTGTTVRLWIDVALTLSWPTNWTRPVNQRRLCGACWALTLPHPLWITEPSTSVDRYESKIWKTVTILVDCE